MLQAVMVVAALSVVESYLRLNSGLGISMELADTDLDHWANSGQAAERTVRVMQSGRVVISGGGSGKGGRKSLETLEAESQKPHRNLIHGDDAHPHSGELAKAAAKAAHRTGPIQVLNLTVRCTKHLSANPMQLCYNMPAYCLTSGSAI